MDRHRVYRVDKFVRITCSKIVMYQTKIPINFMWQRLVAPRTEMMHEICDSSIVFNLKRTVAELIICRLIRLTGNIISPLSDVIWQEFSDLFLS